MYRTENVKFRFGGKRYPVRLDWNDEEGYVDLSFGFYEGLRLEIKASMDVRWMGFAKKNPRKVWRAKISPRNLFRLSLFMEQNPYARYDLPLPDWECSIQLQRVLDARGVSMYNHQKVMSSHIYHRNYTIIAGEMGTGKSLACLEVMQKVINDHSIANPWMECWYVGPKTGCSAISRELKKWGYTFEPRIFTYEAMTKAVSEWADGTKAPRILVVDESSKVKTPTAKRSQAVMHVANAIRAEHGDAGYVTLMSGTPSPKSPADWFYQCEIACPGFLREANVAKFRERMSIVEMRESPHGQYPHLIAWKDTDQICESCGTPSDHKNHQQMTSCPITGKKVFNQRYHKYIPCTNEVALLFQRMAGLVDVKFKKDCLDLPEKRYETIKIQTTPEIMRAARLIKSTSPRAVTALTRLRSLSDGFQYSEEPCGKEECTVCQGHGHTKVPVAVNPTNTDGLVTANISGDDFTFEDMICPNCGGTGEVTRYKRSREDTYSPKDDALIDLLEQFEEHGRIVIWGGFTGTIEKVLELCQKQGWATLRYDKVVQAMDADGNIADPEEFLDAMDGSHPNLSALLKKYPMIAFVGHPKAGGMGLTLTASPGCVYYSNDFSGEGRIQSEDRVHRAGMDANRGCTIYDLVHLPTDQLVIDNLQKKRELQSLTLGELDEAMKEKYRD